MSFSSVRVAAQVAPIPGNEQGLFWDRV